MKRFLGIALIVCLGILMVGCGNKEEKNNVQSGDNIGGEVISGEKDTKKESPIKVETTEENLRINVNNQYTMVFEFVNEKVAGYYWEYSFATTNEASEMEASFLNRVGDGKVLAVERNETVVKVYQEFSKYANSSRDEIEDMFMYLQENS